MGWANEFDGNLRRRDLENPDNPYNTYQHRGLAADADRVAGACGHSRGVATELPVMRCILLRAAMAAINFRQRLKSTRKR